MAMKATVHSIEVVEMTATEIAMATANDLMAYAVEVSYGDSSPESVQFVGTRRGAPGPVYLIVYPGKVSHHRSFAANFDDPEETQVQVVAPERFGVRFNGDWIKNFFSEEVDS